MDLLEIIRWNAEQVGNNIVFATQQVGNAAGLFVDGCAKYVRQVEGLQTISDLGLNTIKALQVNNVVVVGMEGLQLVFISTKDIIAARKIVPRLDELMSGDALQKHAEAACGNILRFTSRIAYLVQDTFKMVSVLEKFAVLAAGTGNGISIFLVQLSADTIVPIFGFAGIAIDLADQVSIAFKKGLTWDTGLTITGDLARLVIIGVGGSSVYGLIMLGVVSAATASITGIVRFVKTEYRV